MFYSDYMSISMRSIMRWAHYECLNCGHEETLGDWERKIFVMPKEWIDDEL
jgi:hypothetical protein